MWEQQILVHTHARGIPTADINDVVEAHATEAKRVWELQLVEQFSWKGEFSSRT